MLLFYCPLVVLLMGQMAGNPIEQVSELGCGRAPIAQHLNKSVMAEKAIPHSWPWVVALCTMDDGKSYSCVGNAAGTIVGKRWIMTTSLAGEEAQIPFVRVITGMNDLLNPHEPESAIYEIGEVFTSNLGGREFDISLLRLKSEIAFGEHVQPICLPEYDDALHVNGSTAWVAGWCYTSDLELSLGFAYERNISQWYVNPVLNFFPELPPTYVTDETHEKQFLYGVPLLGKHNDVWFQYGILSEDLGYLAVFVRTTYQCQWISETTNGEVNCKGG